MPHEKLQPPVLMVRRDGGNEYLRTTDGLACLGANSFRCAMVSMQNARKFTVCSRRHNSLHLQFSFEIGEPQVRLRVALVVCRSMVMWCSAGSSFHPIRVLVHQIVMVGTGSHRWRYSLPSSPTVISSPTA